MSRLCVLLPLLAACHPLGSGEPGNGTPKTETRQVAAFSEISLSGALHADVTSGAVQSVEISGDDNIVPLIATDVSDNALRVHPTKSVAPKLDLVARIATPTLTAISASGAIQAKVQGIATSAFDIHGSGAVQISAAGTADKLTIDISGAGQIDVNDLHAKDVSIHASGSADIAVFATGILDVHCSGSSHVRYAGNPTDVRKDLSGSSSVQPR